MFGDPPDPEEKVKVGLSSRVYKNKIVVDTLKCLEQNQPEVLQKMYQKRKRDVPGDVTLNFDISDITGTVVLKQS